MLAQQRTSPASDRSMPLDEMLTRLDEIERSLQDALALAQTSCRVCQQALTMTECLRSRIADGVRDPLTARQAIHDCVGERGQPSMQVGAGRRVDGRVELLTPREREVLDLIAGGHSNRQIAEILFLSPRTIERHIANIYLKLDVHTKAEATAWVLVHGLVGGEAVSNGSVAELADCFQPENYIYRLHTSTDAGLGATD
ncbi:MAG TPA: LuxR C-terminal-related transcriptional regulator [Thermomicrobiales bacterium]|nr:LuxR C-terminal-related transcriptional regulator [Thermomicrobiales bacterium]